MQPSSPRGPSEIIPSTRATAVIFGPSADVYGPFVNALAPQVVRVAYRFMDDDEFAAKESSGAYRPGQVNQIIWREILMRAHMAAGASLVRTGRWVEAVVREHDAPNLMGWTACCRGLVEAIGDTADALIHVCMTLAEHHHGISAALSAVNERNLSMWHVEQELEDTLIHFSHARSITRADKTAPRSHRKKQTADYIAILDRMGIAGVKDLYAELCEFMHPAASSVHCMFVQTDDGMGGRIDLLHDARVIEDLLARHRRAFQELLMAAFNPVLVTLRVLAHFVQLPEAKTLQRMDFSRIQLWTKIEALLRR